MLLPCYCCITPVHPTSVAAQKQFSSEDSVDHNSAQNHPIELILVSFNSARRVLSNELSFVYSNFSPQKSPHGFDHFEPHISARTCSMVSFDSALSNKPSFKKLSISLLIPKSTIHLNLSKFIDIYLNPPISPLIA